MGLLTGYRAERHQDREVYSSYIIQYAPNYSLNMLYVFLGYGGDVSCGSSRCALLPNCLGWGEYGQCWGLVGVSCLYFWSFFCNVTWHEDVEGSFVVIPLQFYPAVQVAVSILGVVVVLL